MSTFAFTYSDLTGVVTTPAYVAAADPGPCNNAPMSNGMNLSQLIQAVYTETNRPDMVPETLQAVLESTLTLHSTEFYFRDIVESLVSFDNPSAYIQQLDGNSIPHFRSMAYIRKTDPSVFATEQYGSMNITGAQTSAPSFNFLTRRDIGNILDGYGYEDQDIWYQAGKQINIKSSTALSYCVIGYYKFPVLDATGQYFSSWIADDFPYAIVYRACGSIFAKIGEDKSYGIYMRQPVPGRGLETGGLFYQILDQLQKNSIKAEGS